MKLKLEFVVTLVVASFLLGIPLNIVADETSVKHFERLGIFFYFLGGILSFLVVLSIFACSIGLKFSKTKVVRLRNSDEKLQRPNKTASLPGSKKADNEVPRFYNYIFAHIDLLSVLGMGFFFFFFLFFNYMNLLAKPEIWTVKVVFIMLWSLFISFLLGMNISLLFSDFFSHISRKINGSPLFINDLVFILRGKHKGRIAYVSNFDAETGFIDVFLESDKTESIIMIDYQVFRLKKHRKR
jgi:hypothetical protein